MRIKCISNERSFLPQKLHEYYNNTVPLSIGKSYIVYSLREDLGFTFFCIYDNITSAPMWYPQHFFAVEDQRLSKFWIFNFHSNSQNVQQLFLGFSEWANNEYFYNDLFDGEEEVCAIFHAYEKLMNVEFPDPAIVETAQIGDDKWLICPLCIDAWESNSQDAIVTCPKCWTAMNNPRYKNSLPSYKL